MTYASKSFVIAIVLLAICVLTFLTFNSTGCTKKEIVTEVVHDTTTQNIIFCTLSLLYSDARLFTIPITDPDSADLMRISDNDTIVFCNKYIEDTNIGTPAYLYFFDSTHCNQGENYEVRLESNAGVAEGNITIPENVYIAQPLEGDTLPIGDVVILWTQAQYADFYFIDAWLSWYDSSGNWINDRRLDTLIGTTSLVLPYSFFNYPGAAYFTFSFDIVDYAGPMPIPGTDGNMIGVVNGYLLGEGNRDHSFFYVGTPVKRHHKNKTKNETSFINLKTKYLQMLGIN